jgi:hypothetical protein
MQARDVGKEIGHRYERWTLAPGDNLGSQSPRVRAIAEAAWSSAREESQIQAVE